MEKYIISGDDLRCQSLTDDIASGGCTRFRKETYLNTIVPRKAYNFQGKQGTK